MHPQGEMVVILFLALLQALASATDSSTWLNYKKPEPEEAAIAVAEEPHRAVSVLEFPASSGELRRRKRGVIPPINFPENNRGPFPKQMVQIKSSYIKYTGIVYSITGEGADQPPVGLFTINRNNGTLYVTRLLDREEKDYYVLQAHAVSVDDGLKENPMELIVNVIDMNDNKPIFTQNPFLGSVPGASAKGFEFMTVMATDADEPGNYNSEVMYSIISQNPQLPNPNMFDINPVTGAIRVNSEGLDREKYPEYTLEIQAADFQGEGHRTTGKAVITVTDSNDHAPLFERTSYSNSVPENEVGALVAKLPVTDGDEAQSPAWTAKFRIIRGNYGGFFSVSTGPNGQEGIITTVKPLDFEQNKKYTLMVVVENDGPFATQLPTSTATVTVDVLDVNEAPVFDPKEKRISKSEDLPVDSELVLFTATDPDTGKEQKVIYSVGSDPAGWLSVDRDTGLIKVKSRMDRESRFVQDGRYKALILAMNDDQAPGTGTGTVVIELLDVNDHAPTVEETTIRMCKEGSAPALLSVTDRDGPGFTSPYRVELVGDSKVNWNAMMYKMRTGIILSPRTALKEGGYDVVLRVHDARGLNQDSTIHVSVLNCSGDISTTSPETVKISVQDVNNYFCLKV